MDKESAELQMSATGQTPPFRVLIVTPVQEAGALPEMLTQFGYRVTALVSSAAEALDTLEEKAVDVVLLDVSRVDEPNGVSLLDWLRTHSIPFVWMASNKDRNPVDELVAQPSPTLTRPFRAQQVWTTLEIIRCRHVNKDILKREREKTLLLSLSKDMATIRDRNDLWRVIVEKIQPIVAHRNAHIAILNASGELASLLLQQHDETIQNTIEYQKHQQVWFPVKNSPFELALQCESPKVYTRADYTSQYPGSWEMQLWAKAGIEESLEVPLKWHNRVIGLFKLLSNEKQGFAQTNFCLVKAIADQVAVAVANILANEEILEREREMEALLSVTEAMAKVRDREELFSLIVEKIQPLFGFNQHTNIAVYHPGSHSLRMFFTKMNPGEQQESQIPKFMDFPVEGIFQIILDSSEIVITDESWKTSPKTAAIDTASAQIWRDLDFKYALSVALRSFDKLIGTFHVHFYEAKRFTPAQLRLFQAISDQVAVAVANILANEEILEREREKALQLTLSTALTEIRDWEGRFDQVSRLIGQLISWSVFSVSLSGPGYTRTYRFQQAGDVSPSPLPIRQLQRDTGLPLDTLLGIQQDERSFYATAGLYLSEHYEALRAAHPYVEMMHQYYQIRSMAVVPLPMDIAGRGESALVVESTHPSGFTPEQFSCLQRLGSYIGLVTEKLLAFEDIQKREREKSLQLAINNLLVTLKDRDVLFGTMASEINKVVPCQFFVVRVLRRAGGAQYRVLLERQLPDGFLKVWEGTDDYPPLPDGEAHPLTPEMENQPGVYVGEAFQAFCGQSPLYRTALEKQGARSALRLQFPLSDELDTVMVLADSLPFAFTEEDFALLGQLTPQISLALDNLFAFERIASLQALLEGEKAYLQEEIKGSYNFEEIIGSSPALREVFTKISKVAPTDTTVLILGETGTGKELIARAVHNLSRRKDRVLIKVNCAALPPQLIESDLFGHERGAFTGAHERRIGKFELANGGTLFLDEIGELPLELQAKLLRVLQEGEFERLGGKGTLKTDVRIIAATNRELENESEAGKFRPDLYYRLNVFPITLPPLRERKEDIPLLAMHFTQKFAQKMGKKIRSIANEALQEMLTYRWPGNIRELEHIVERSVILSGTSTLELSNPLKRTKLPAMGEAGPPPIKTLKEAERELIIAVLQLTGGRIRGKGAAAEVLDIEPTTLEARMKKLGIVKKLVVAKD